MQRFCAKLCVAELRELREDGSGWHKKRASEDWITQHEEGARGGPFFFEAILKDYLARNAKSKPKREGVHYVLVYLRALVGIMAHWPMLVSSSS